MPASTAKGRRTVEQILDAAESVVAAEGHVGASTRRIAAEAGVDKRVLSYYFDSREALLAEVVRRTATRVAALISEDLAASPDAAQDPRAALDVIWGRIVEVPALVRTYVSILGADTPGGQLGEAIEGMTIMYSGLARDALLALGHDERAAGRLGAVVTVTIRGLLLSWSEGAPETLVDDTLSAMALVCARERR